MLDFNVGRESYLWRRSELNLPSQTAIYVNEISFICKSGEAPSLPTVRIVQFSAVPHPLSPTLCFSQASYGKKWAKERDPWEVKINFSGVIVLQATKLEARLLYIIFVCYRNEKFYWFHRGNNNRFMPFIVHHCTSLFGKACISF